MSITQVKRLSCIYVQGLFMSLHPDLTLCGLLIRGSAQRRLHPPC